MNLPQWYIKNKDIFNLLIFNVSQKSSCKLLASTGAESIKNRAFLPCKSLILKLPALNEKIPAGKVLVPPSRRGTVCRVRITIAAVTQTSSNGSGTRLAQAYQRTVVAWFTALLHWRIPRLASFWPSASALSMVCVCQVPLRRRRSKRAPRHTRLGALAVTWIFGASSVRIEFSELGWQRS